VVKSDAPTDRLESDKLPYSLGEDTSKWAIPSGITIVDRELVTRKLLMPTAKRCSRNPATLLFHGEPANWNEIKQNTDPDKDIVSISC